MSRWAGTDGLENREAIPALRYFYEDMPDLPVVSAGSLLEFVLADHSFSMPVGRIQYLHMSPMTFSEFLLAMAKVVGKVTHSNCNGLPLQTDIKERA